MKQTSKQALLTVEDMAQADRLAEAAGVPSLTLMENAGQAVADAASALVPLGGRIVILCGPGNNGGDGFVAARVLAQRGFDLVVVLIADRSALRGDAAHMARLYVGPVVALEVATFDGATLIIDALFGAGLSRPLEGAIAAFVRAANDTAIPILAVDVPSGLDGNTGQWRGAVIQAVRTVTFFRRKPGHLLLPGRLLCGDVEIADIGIPPSVLDRIAVAAWANAPDLWSSLYPWPSLVGHKYDRGHALVVAGPKERTGAARLGARAALRAGAGLVTLACTPDSLEVVAAQLTAIMLESIESADALRCRLEDKRLNVVLIGPGTGIGDATRARILVSLASGAACVLDADALTSWSDHRDALLFAIRQNSEWRARNARTPAVVLTPHDGEFSRLFPEIIENNRLTRARRAAEHSGATVILKGADTVVAAPDGRAVINDNAPPWLATAGAGDVLAGIVAGLLAQDMPAFEAAAAAVWLHGACAQKFGLGLIAEDLTEVFPRVLQAMHGQCEASRLGRARTHIAPDA
jgi:ADP-dependent NAD(P)H-hydrate dehydratase / NAD(P)H-hydrate epimerase